MTPASTDTRTEPPAPADRAPDEPPPPAPEPAAGRAVPALVRRRLAPFDARLDPYSWLAAGVVTLIAGILRFLRLDQPGGIVFDETYYATEGQELLRYGVEWDQANDVAAFVVHPPLGKWMIGLGQLLLGENEWGWRVPSAVVGTLTVLMVARIGRRMFGSTILGCVAALLVALDGMHLVMSRFALLDIFLTFFVVAAFGALLLDRDARRRRWLRALEAGLDPGRAGRAGRPAFRWRDGVPWWRLLAGALAGCAMAVKWSAIFYIVVFAVLVLVWEAGARRSAGVRRPWRDTFLDETGWLVATAGALTAVYLASWTGWFLTDDGYMRHHLSGQGLAEPPFFGALVNLYHYHEAALGFHTGLADDHPYQSWPWQWLLLARPTLFHWTGEVTCSAASCASSVLLLGTPLLWWSFLPALAALVWLGIARRDWRATPLLLGAGAGIVPWFWYALDERTMFYFYALPAQPFLVLAVVYVLGAIMSPSRAERPGRLPAADRRLYGTIVLGAYVILVAACFAYFYPIYVGEPIPYDSWQARMWLGQRWI